MTRPSEILPPHLRLPLCAVLGAALVACTGTETGDYKHGALPAKDEGKAEVKAEVKADAKADAKADEGEADADAGGCDDPKVLEQAKKFHKGVVAPKGLKPAQVAAYNASQGDPTCGKFTLEDAFAGDDTLADKSAGTLTAVFHTTMGDFSCELFEDKVPNTVANFVGLARGTRPWFDKIEDKWRTDEPYYNGIVFHRVVRGFMNQTGDRAGTGRGNPGFIIVDEFDRSLRHKGPGILSMANRGPNTASSQFFVTVKTTKHLDNKHAVFGKCRDMKVPMAINEVPVQGERPIKKIEISKVEIVREPEKK